MNVTDRVCNLECMKEGDVHEFVGPVKIVLVDPPEDQYRRRRAGGAATALANVLMGANIFCIILFCFGFHLKQYINTHILLCTVGYQLCMPYAILMLNPLFGAAAPMKQANRRLNHVILQVIGMCLYVTGTVLAILFGEKSPRDPPTAKTSVHFFAGLLAAILAGACFLTGPCLLFSEKEKTTPTRKTSIHKISGIITFTLSSACFITGVLKPMMCMWFAIMGYMMPLLLVILFCVYYTAVVITPPINSFRPSCVAAGFAGLCILSGPCLFCSNKEKITQSCFTYVHRYLGIFAVLAGSVCFVTGIIKPTFQVWLYILGYMAPTYMIVFCCAFYTLVVITTPLSRCCEK